MTSFFRAPRVLGVGFPYAPAIPSSFYEQAPLDFIEITPEELCRERRAPGRSTLALVPRFVEEARAACASRPIVVHGVELSIGSACGWNEAYLDLLDQLFAVWPFAWHSEHLAYQTAPDAAGRPTAVGVPMPLPFTEEAAELVAERAARLLARYPVPFLLENPAHYLSTLFAEPSFPDEAAFINRITERSGCGQLLDLHNLYCNAMNLGQDPFMALGRLRLERVVEIHVAGGTWRSGFLMDSHAERVPEAVWEMLDYTLPRAPNVAGLVYETLDETSAHLSLEARARELERAHEVWRRHRRPRAGAA